MTIKNTVIQYLESQPLFRERKNKDKGIVNLLMKRYPALGSAIESGVIQKQQVVDLVQDYASMDRFWRQSLEQNPHLRGTDYDDKERLEQERKIAMGYGQGPSA